MIRGNKIIKYAERSKILDINLTYGTESFSFNLNTEAIVDENKINNEIKNQPSAYAFLGMLHKKLTRLSRDKKREMEKTYAMLFIKYKDALDPNTGRPIANDLVKEKVIASRRYQDSVISYHQAQENEDILETCVKTFEQRHSLIQTLSANIRKTN